MERKPATLGYCTNVHAGVTLREVQDNLVRHAVEVKHRLAWDRPLGVGLWLAVAAAEELTRQAGAIERFRDWLVAQGLEAYTFNGFPYDNFHMPVVKHRVYNPTWCETSRRDYTLRLIEIMDGLLPPGQTGSISTLPIAWGNPRLGEDEASRSAELLLSVAERLRSLEETKGRRIVLAIEPEPGCYLQSTQDVVAYFDRYLKGDHVRRYLTVCHDVCHASVMNEGQAAALMRFRQAGITIGKVQVSAAIEVPWSEYADDGERRLALDELRGFAEDRYLHQVGCVDSAGEFRLIEDLPQAIAAMSSVTDRVWRIHFHVPIHLQRFGRLRSTQGAILECFERLKSAEAEGYWTGHYEVETYAWNVLPEGMRPAELAEGIAAELQWLSQRV